MLLEIFILIISILLIIFQIFTWNNGYWKKRGIPHKSPRFLFGNLKDVLTGKESFIDFVVKFCKNYEEYKYFGMHWGRTPVLVVKDPELAKSILIKDFNSFHDNAMIVHPKADPLFELNPFIQRGEKWRTMRSQLTPLLTMGKVKNMFESMSVVCTRLKNHILKNLSTFENGVDVHLLAQQYTVENFGLNGLTINADAFEDVNNEFRKIADQVFNTTGSCWDVLASATLMTIDPQLSYLLRSKLISNSATNCFRQAVNNVLKHRVENGLKYNDYFDQVRDISLKYKNDKEFLTAQILTLFLDGVETSSSALRSLIYEVSQKPEIFQKLRNEIDTAITESGGFTYEAIQQMKFLDACLMESLRLYTPIGFLLRDCTQTYQLPPQKGSPNGVTLDKGSMVAIAVHALHLDPKNYVDPEQFRPERWMEENAELIINKIHIPFGDGPRQCLGTRYAILQVKMAAVTLIRNFDLILNEKTPYPSEIVGALFFYTPKEPVIVNIFKRK